MRQTCPNCGADYDIPEGMVGAAGRHVQCSACHTRWFVRGVAATPAGEDQILTRLENWRPRAVPISAFGGEATAAEHTPPAARQRPAEPLRVVPSPAFEAEAEARTAPKPAAPAAPVQREHPTKPAAHPTVARPAAVAAPSTQPAPRLALDARRLEHAPEVKPAPRSRFLHGFFLVPVLVLVALVAYRFDDGIAAAVPAAGPALGAYAATIDGWRADIEEVIGAYRPRAG